MIRALLFSFICLVICISGCQQPVSTAEEPQEVISVETVPSYLYGFREDSIDVFQGTIGKNVFLSTLLAEFGVSFQKVYNLSEKAKDIFPVTNLRSGKPYTIISTGSCFKPDYFIYQPSVFRYVKFDLRDTCHVEIVHNPIDTVRKSATGIINGSLWLTMEKQGVSPALIDRMEDALAWSVDFYHIQNGDRFKVIYDQYFIDGKRAGVGALHGAVYETGEKKFYSIHFKSAKYDGYFDEEGRTMKKAFLKSPVKYGRISSRYNLRRFHPVLKRTRPHLGTDYAAPKGTPIMSVANGTVTHVARTRNNGNYVKVKHDKTYSTQYLHMSRHVKGMKAGDKVKQGETIGYVGQTGLATGPHVCFRFWKNGKQVDPRRQNLPPPEPMDPIELPEYFKVRDDIKMELDQMLYEPLFQEATINAVDSSIVPT